MRRAPGTHPLPWAPRHSPLPPPMGDGPGGKGQATGRAGRRRKGVAGPGLPPGFDSKSRWGRGWCQCLNARGEGGLTTQCG